MKLITVDLSAIPKNTGYNVEDYVRIFREKGISFNDSIKEGESKIKKFRLWVNWKTYIVCTIWIIDLIL